MPDEIVAIIIIFGFVLPVTFYVLKTRHEKAMMKLTSQLDKSEKENLQNQMNGMKKRLEVLEAIVTDSKYQLSKEISELKVVDK